MDPESEIRRLAREAAAAGPGSWARSPDSVLRHVAKRARLEDHASMVLADRRAHAAVGGPDLVERAEADWADAMHEMFGTLLPRALGVLRMAKLPWKHQDMNKKEAATEAVGEILALASSTFDAAGPPDPVRFVRATWVLDWTVPHPIWAELRTEFGRVRELALALRSIKPGPRGHTLPQRIRAHVRAVVEDWADAHTWDPFRRGYVLPPWFRDRVPNSGDDALVADLFAAGARSGAAVRAALARFTGRYETWRRPGGEEEP